MKLRALSIASVLAATLLCSIAATVASTPAVAVDDASLHDVLARERIRIGVRADAPAFSALNLETQQPEGLEVDLAREIAKRILGDPDKIELTIVKSDNRIPLVQSGAIDMFIATATITPARLEQIDFSNVYYRAGQSLLVSRGSPIRSYRDLPGRAVCTVAGSTPEQTIRRLAPAANVVTFESYADCLQGLRSGRVDAVTTDDTILTGFVQQDPANLTLVGEPFSFEPYGIGFKRGSTALEGAVNHALTEIERSGEFRRLCERWLKTPPPPDVHRWFGMSPAAAAAQFASHRPG